MPTKQELDKISLDNAVDAFKSAISRGARLPKELPYIEPSAESELAKTISIYNEADEKRSSGRELSIREKEVLSKVDDRQIWNDRQGHIADLDRERTMRYKALLGYDPLAKPGT